MSQSDLASFSDLTNQSRDSVELPFAAEVGLNNELADPVASRCWEYCSALNVDRGGMVMIRVAQQCCDRITEAGESHIGSAHIGFSC